MMDFPASWLLVYRSGSEKICLRMLCIYRGLSNSNLYRHKKPSPLKLTCWPLNMDGWKMLEDEFSFLGWPKQTCQTLNVLIIDAFTSAIQEIFIFIWKVPTRGKASSNFFSLKMPFLLLFSSPNLKCETNNYNMGEKGVIFGGFKKTHEPKTKTQNPSPWSNKPTPCWTCWLCHLVRGSCGKVGCCEAK